MVAAGDYVFKVEGIEIEGFNDAGVDVQYPWEDIPRRYHEHKMHISAFYMDKYPVTNADFKKFVDATHYHPADDLDFLKDWKDGNYPEGWADKPVTWVSLEDARAYAKWTGKRLPHEWEWQYAAQGIDGRIYPWGNDWDATRVPAVDHGRTMRGPDSVVLIQPEPARQELWTWWETSGSGRMNTSMIIPGAAFCAEAVIISRWDRCGISPRPIGMINTVSCC